MALEYVNDKIKGGKNMKNKLIALLMAAVMTLSTPIAALATETGDVSKKAGITPDSILYPVDKLIEDIREALTSNDVDKAILLTDCAEERLAEAQLMMKEGETKLAQVAADNYTGLTGKVNDTIQHACGNKESSKEDETTGSSISTLQDKDNDGINDILEELIERNATLQKNSINVLAELLKKVPEQSKEAITKAIVNQIMRAKAVKDFVTAKKAYNEGKKEVKGIEKELKDVQKSGDKTKIDAAYEALENANKKLQELAAQKNEAWNAKKNVKTSIENKLSEMNITSNKSKESNGNKVLKTVPTFKKQIKGDVKNVRFRAINEVKNESKQKDIIKNNKSKDDNSNKAKNNGKNKMVRIKK
jgi:hypothetical protein